LNTNEFQTRIGVYLCHTPAATSVKNILHWAQIVKSRKCEKFDYGPKGNMKEYGKVSRPLSRHQQFHFRIGCSPQETPPVFDLRKITTPTYLYWSKDDILADTEDIRSANNCLFVRINRSPTASQESILSTMNATIRGSYELPHYTHLDFVFGINATNDVYQPIVDKIRQDFITRKMLRNNCAYIQRHA
uniref:Lipase_3 domain-containing protein n=1 Tax=Angiostrongylus cantonensis TaxID=6313 RepID=A0A0K0CYI8_ANGCA